MDKKFSKENTFSVEKLELLDSEFAHINSKIDSLNNRFLDEGYYGCNSEFQNKIRFIDAIVMMLGYDGNQILSDLQKEMARKKLINTIMNIDFEPDRFKKEILTEKI